MSDVIIPTFNFLASLSVSVVIYRLSPWHPLAQYPGPVLARLSKWWMAYWIGKGNRHSLIQQLHAQYGPWLRIGPNEISVAHSAAIRPIYGKMFRAPFYQGAPQDADALITTLDQAEHAARLVAWQKAFTTDSLRNFRSFLLARTEQLLECLHRESSQGKTIDFSHWIGLWAMDVMGDMSFSGGFETMAAGRDEEGWMEVLQIGVLFVGILGQVPWMKDLIALLPQPTPIITFHQFASKKVHETKARDKGARQDILGIIQDEGSGGPPLSAQQATADASFMVVAGSDTVSQTVTALFRRIAGDPKIQDRLRLEIDSAFAKNSDIDSFTLSKLPYLDACIQETLRLMPPVAAGPPRYSGAQGCQVLDKYIPPGTTVACPIYTLHRDSCNFKDPDLFQPERWLSGSLGGPHNVEAFFPFGYGHGVCIGKPVALHNMKLLQTLSLSFSKGFDPRKFDLSYKEHNLWRHDPLLLDVTSI
ncbi:cytochrome P450 [Infundibulicybe gibba]|nr:cytochrome P450 [Infundibulicybe gibba]